MSETRLLDFLMARIREDEAAATAATQPDEMHPWGDRTLPPTPVEGWPDEVRGYLGGTWGEHCARWHPARVLAECDAKRAVLAALDVTEDPTMPAVAWVIARGVLRTLAVPYVAHPDYRDEWRP